MKKTKIIIGVIAGFLAVLLPFVSVVAFAVSMPPQYTDTFVGELNEKVERLNSIDEPKIVVVGGSSVAFGLDSALLEKYTGMPVVNFGLYAALGTKVMLDLSRGGIKEGDIVILAPELDAQTLSLYFSSDTTLKALDDDFSMFFDIDVENWFNMLGGMWKFAGEKLERYKDSKANPVKPESNEIYQSKYFDEYGDFDYPRPENIMDIGYDMNTMIELSPNVVGKDFAAFSEYLNEYIKDAERKGATVLFSYCPMNASAVTDNSTDENRKALDAFLRENINCEFISDMNDYVLDEYFFFDTNFHLNEDGVKVRTLRLARDVRIAMGISNGIIDATEPTVPTDRPDDKPDYTFEGVDENAKYFTYVLEEYGAYSITGLSEEGKAQTSLTVPLGYNGIKVTAIKENAFSGSSLEKLVITADSNITRLANESFSGASSLKELWIYKSSGDEINPPLNFLGTHADFKVHIPAGSDFDVHYYWSERGLEFVFDAN